MKKIHLLLIAILLSFGLNAQVFTPIHNYQAPDGLAAIKAFGIPYGPDTTWNGVNPTLNGVTNKFPGFLFYRTTDSTLYVWAGTRWIVAGGRGGGSGAPTKVYVKRPLTVDETTNPGFQTLGELHDDGLISGGIVTSAGCLLLHVTPSFYYLNNGTGYFSVGTDLTVSTPDPSLPRTDRIVVDINGIVTIIPGTPSISPQAPPYNRASQWSIATYPVGAGATCLAINSIVIYDETGGTEYTPSTHGAITADPADPANPEHLTVAYHITMYADGSKLTFKKTSGQDTVFNNSVFRFGLYINNPLLNTVEMQTFLAGVPTTSSIVINPYISVFDTLEYQTVGVPGYAFGASGNIIEDSIVFTFRGEDTSGASGLFFDWFQLQTGLTNTAPSIYLTTDSTSGPATLVGNHLNIPNYATGGITADNGLNISSGSNVQLGGPLLQQTTIDAGPTQTTGLVITGQDDNRAPFTVTTTGTQPNSADNIAGTFVANVVHSSGGENIGIRSTATSGDGVGKGVEATGDYVGVLGTSDAYGIWGVSPSGYGIFGTSTNGLPGVLQAIPSSTNTVVPIISLTRSSSGTAANGIGGSLDFRNQNITNLENISNQVVSKWTDATFATRTSELSFTGVNSGTTQTLFTLSGNGQGRLNLYGSGTFTGTPTGTLQVTSNGSIIEGSVSGGGTVTNIATGYGLSGGPITSTGTIIVDSAAISNYFVRRKDSVANGYYPYSTNPKNYLTTIDTTNIANFSTKVHSLFSANAPITYNSGTGKIAVDTSTAITGLTTLYKNSLKLNITDTTNHWVNQISKNATHDSIVYYIGSTRYAVRDSIGGGGTGLTRQVITSGTTATVTGGNYIVTIDPASTIASFTLTLPASPSDLQTVQVDFGGTLTSGTIVTALTISPNTAQTILDNTPPGNAMADNTIFYRYRSSNTTWYRFKP